MPKISKRSAFELLVFLDNRPLNAFPNVQSFRKIASSADDIRTQIQGYYDTTVKLEEKVSKLVKPYRDRARVIQEGAEGEERSEKNRIVFQEKLSDINREMRNDKELQKADKALKDHHVKGAEERVDLNISSSEYRTALKEHFEKSATEAIKSKDALLEIAEYMDNL